MTLYGKIIFCFGREEYELFKEDLHFSCANKFMVELKEFIKSTLRYDKPAK